MNKRFILSRTLTKELGLRGNQNYFAEETNKGYSIKLNNYSYIGFPKFLVEKNKRNFKLTNGKKNY